MGEGDSQKFSDFSSFQKFFDDFSKSIRFSLENEKIFFHFLNSSGFLIKTLSKKWSKILILKVVTFKPVFCQLKIYWISS